MEFFLFTVGPIYYGPPEYENAALMGMHTQKQIKHNSTTAVSVLIE